MGNCCCCCSSGCDCGLGCIPLVNARPGAGRESGTPAGREWRVSLGFASAGLVVASGALTAVSLRENCGSVSSSFVALKRFNTESEADDAF